MSKTLVAATGLFLVAAPAADAPLHFHPAAETTLERTASVALTLGLADYALTQMGEPVEPGDLDESLDPDEMGTETTMEATYSDTFVRTERGRALEFVRTYETLLVDGEESEETEEEDGTIEVARFVWNGEEGRYEVTAPELDELTDEQREQLEAMRADVDHTHLLPSGEVAVGDSWQVELGASGLVAAVMPFFEWDAAVDAVLREARSDADTEPAQAELMNDLFTALEAGLEDTVATLTYKGRRAADDGGATVAVMDVEVETAMDMDLGDRLLEMIEEEMEVEGAEGAVPQLELVVEIELSGEGELLWNTDGNHLHTLELPLDLEILVEGRFAIELPGLGELEFVAGDAIWEGELEILQTATRR